MADRYESTVWAVVDNGSELVCHSIAQALNWLMVNHLEGRVDVEDAAGPRRPMWEYIDGDFRRVPDAAFLERLEEYLEAVEEEDEES